MKINVKIISKLKLIKRILLDESIEYLFLVDQPTKNIIKVKIQDKKKKKSILYSISTIDIFGPHTKFIQNI